MESAAPRYTPTAIALHWVLAVAIVGSSAVGWYMSDLKFSPLQLKLYNWHKWAGMTILLLSIGRLAWRLTHRPPELPSSVTHSMPPWQVRAYHGVHHAMYVLFFVVPLVGWAYSSAAGFPVVLFGVLPLPDFVPVDKPLSEILKLAHKTLAFTLGAVVLAHVGAALKHQFIDRDGLLARMGIGRAAT